MSKQIDSKLRKYKKTGVANGIQWQEAESYEDSLWNFNAIFGDILGLKLEATNAYEMANGKLIYIDSDAQVTIETLEGDMVVENGSYIMIGHENEMWPIKESIFEATYTEIDMLPEGGAYDNSGTLDVLDAVSGEFGHDESEDEREAQLVEKGLDAPRLCPADIDAVIKSDTYTMLPSGKCMVCELTLKNGYTVRGESACVSPKNFDVEIGQDISYKDAREKIWGLEAYVLQNKFPC